MESADTARGRSEHERVHTQRLERRGHRLKLYAYHVFSDELGVSGKCGLLAAEEAAEGCRIPAAAPVRLYLVKCKHGMRLTREIPSAMETDGEAVLRNDRGSRTALRSWQSRKAETIQHPFLKKPNRVHSVCAGRAFCESAARRSRSVSAVCLEAAYADGVTHDVETTSAKGQKRLRKSGGIVRKEWDSRVNSAFEMLMDAAQLAVLKTSIPR